MANFIYNTYKFQLAENTLDWETDTIRCLLERSTSTYTPDPDHDFLDDFTTGGGVEITTGGYSRQPLNTRVNTNDLTNNRTEQDCDNIAFSTLSAGQTVKAIIIYRQVGGDDTTPANDDLIAYIDTTTGTTLPVALSGGTFTVVIDVEGLIQLT